MTGLAEQIGHRIRAARTTAGIGQTELGRRMGPLLGKPWARQTVSLVESGGRNVSVQELLAVAEALGVDPAALLTGVKNATTPEPAALDPEDIAALTAVDKDSGKTVFELRQCRHCGGLHARTCPRVKRMSFAPDSNKLVEVEFWPSGQWSDQHIIWPEMLGVMDGGGVDSAGDGHR